MSTALIVRPGADARLELELEGMRPGWKAAVAVYVRRMAPPIYTASLRIQPGRLVIEIPGSETATWAFGVGSYDVRFIGPKGQQEIPYSDRVYVDRR